MRIRLIRRLAERIDGVDLSRRRVGDSIDLPQREADVLIAEGWACAVHVERQGDRRRMQRRRARPILRPQPRRT